MISSFVQLLREIQCSVQGIKLSSATETPANLDRQLEEIENKLCYVIIIMTRYQNGCTLPDSVKKGPPFNWDFDDGASTPSNSPLGIANFDDDSEEERLQQEEGEDNRKDGSEETTRERDAGESLHRGWESEDGGVLGTAAVLDTGEMKPSLPTTATTHDPGQPVHSPSSSACHGTVTAHLEKAAADHASSSQDRVAEEDAVSSVDGPNAGAHCRSVKMERDNFGSPPGIVGDENVRSESTTASSSGKKRKRRKKKLKGNKRRDLGGGGAGEESESSAEEGAISGEISGRNLGTNVPDGKGKPSQNKSESETEMAEPLKRFLNINFDELFKASGCTDGSELSDEDLLEDEEEVNAGGGESGRNAASASDDIPGDETDNSGGLPGQTIIGGKSTLIQASRYVTGLPPRPKTTPPASMLRQNHVHLPPPPQNKMITPQPSHSSHLDRATLAPRPSAPPPLPPPPEPPIVTEMVIENEDSQSDTTLFSMSFPCEEAAVSLSVAGNPSPSVESKMETSDPQPVTDILRDPLPPLQPSPPLPSLEPLPALPSPASHPTSHPTFPSLSSASPIGFYPERSLSPSDDLSIRIPSFLLQPNGEEEKSVPDLDDKLTIDEEAKSDEEGGSPNLKYAELTNVGQRVPTDPVDSPPEGGSVVPRVTGDQRPNLSSRHSDVGENDKGSHTQATAEEEEEEEEENYGRWHVVREESTGLPSTASAAETSSSATGSSGGGKKKKKKKSKTKIYPCPLCTLTFTSKSSLKIHQKFDVHDEEKDEAPKEREDGGGDGKNLLRKNEESSSVEDDATAGNSEPQEDDAGDDRESTIVDVEENDDAEEGFGRGAADTVATEEDDEEAAKSDLTLMQRLQMEEKNSQYGGGTSSSSSQEYNFDSTANTHLNSSQEFYPFASSEEASAHLLRNAKPKKKTHKCGDCGKTFSTTGNLNVHYRAIHGGQKLMCGICDRGFAYIYSLKLHMESIHGGRRFPCAECDKDFAYASALKTHEAAVHRGRKFPCKFCQKEFTHSGDVTAHIESLHYGRRFPCKFCVDQKKVFTHRVNLRKHLKDEHGIHPKTTQNMKFPKTYEPTIDGKDFPEEMQKLDRKRDAVLAEEEAAEEEEAAARAAALGGDVDDTVGGELLENGSSSPFPPPPPPPASIAAHKMTFDEALTSKKQMNQRYLCVVCRDEFKAVSALRSHMEMRHPDFVTRPTNGAKPCVSIIQSSKNKQ